MTIKKLGKLCAATVLFASCASDKMDVPNVNEPHDGKTAYINLSLSIPTGISTRADENPTLYDGSEYLVDDCFLYLFKSSDSDYECTNIINIGNSFDDKNKNNNDITSTKVISGLKMEGMAKEDYKAFVIVNTQGFNCPVIGTKWNTWITNAQEGIMYYEKNNSTYFTMTNAFGWIPETNTISKPFVLAEIKEDNFYYESSASSNAGPVEIYVQRVVAKVSLDGESAIKIGGNAVKVTDTEDEIEFTAWDLDILNTKTYPILYDGGENT